MDRFLIPDHITVGQFLYILRKRIQLPPKTAMFIFVNGSVPPTGMLLSVLYESKKDRDGFLYVTYSGESTFGCPVIWNKELYNTPCFRSCPSSWINLIRWRWTFSWLRSSVAQNPGNPAWFKISWKSLVNYTSPHSANLTLLTPSVSLLYITTISASHRSRISSGDRSMFLYRLYSSSIPQIHILSKL